MARRQYHSHKPLLSSASRLKVQSMSTTPERIQMIPGGAHFDPSNKKISHKSLAAKSGYLNKTLAGSMHTKSLLKSSNFSGISRYAFGGNDLGSISSIKKF